MRRFFAAVALATIVACDSLNPTTDNVVTGTWRGSSAGQTFVIALQQSGTAVAGTGTMTSTASGTKTLSISGNFSQPNFTATLTPSGAQPISLQGTVEGRSFVGTLTGGGFNGEGLALTRD